MPLGATAPAQVTTADLTARARIRSAAPAQHDTNRAPLNTGWERTCGLEPKPFSAHGVGCVMTQGEHLHDALTGSI